MTPPELLAPAGDFASVDAAIDHGADAIYAGIGSFNLRAHAPNFLMEDLPELISRVHVNNKRIYLALNTMPDNSMMERIERLLTQIGDTAVLPDALIVSDPGVISLCKEILPVVALHLSTQTGTFNSRSIAFWKAQGISRVVLPRECTLDDISAMSARTTVATEVFIHGAMCVSVSGRCLLGGYLSQRHPNRGDCSQPCRWKYRISASSTDDGKNPSQEYELDAEENGDGTYLMNSKDLCTIEILPRILSSGVTSLKIEGRNKSAHYVATVVKVYRAAIDTWITAPSAYAVLPQWRALLESIEHRPYTTGFYGSERMLQEIHSSKASASTRIIGVVKALLPGGLPVIDIKNSFIPHEPIEVLPVNQFAAPYPFSYTSLTDLSGNVVERPPSNRLVIAHGADTLHSGDMLRKTVTL